MKTILAELDRMATKGHLGKGKFFEPVVKMILETAPEFLSQYRKVWLWDDYPDRGGADLGIDLVAEDKQGERVAIQAKCYAPDGKLTWHDLSTFYGDAMGRAEIKQLMLVTTTDNVSRNAKKQLAGAQKPCAIWTRSDLLKLGIPPRTRLKDLGRAPRAKRFKPRRHQKTAIRKTLDHLKKNKRGQLLMACGTGKTLVGLWIKEEMSVKRTIVFVPSIALLRQTWLEWSQHCSKRFYSVAVCSDERATSRGTDALVSSPSAVGLPPTTDPDVIAKALDVRGPIVVFSTYQSSEVVEEAIKKSGRSFDLMIADEAHNTTSAGLTAFTRPLYDDHIPSKRRIFLTATPRIVSKRTHRRAEEEGYDIHSMDDTEVYGQVAHKLPFSEAIKKNLLTDYEIFVVGVDDSDIADAIQERAFLKIDSSEINGEELAAHIAIHRAMKKRGTRRMITFHSRIKQAQTFSKNVPLVKEWLRKNRRLHAPKVWGDAVSGEMPVVQRERVLARFDALDDGECGIVSNARCLGEGVDVPTIDGISFVQPKRSPIDIVQAVGRAIRKSKKKEGTSTIILPVPILGTADPTDTIKSSAFETVWRVLEALRAHDDVLAESLDELRTKLGARRGGKIRLPKLILDLPRSVNAAFNDAIRLQVLRHSTETFWEGLGYLKAYKTEHGDCRVPAIFRTEDGFTLGTWVVHRRGEYKNERLISDRIDALNKLGFIWDLFEDDYQRGLDYLKAYKAEHGDCRVPDGFTTEDGFTLGRWVANRRSDYQIERLTPDRIDALNKLGFIWDPIEEVFQEGLRHLKAYKAEHGDCRVPYGFTTEDGFRLGRWVSHKRTDYKVGRVTQDRIDALNAVGFIWDAQTDLLSDKQAPNEDEDGESAQEPVEHDSEEAEAALPTDEGGARVPVSFEMVPAAGVAVPAPPDGEQLGRAKDLVRDGRIEEAIALYRDILVQNPANLKARNNLGVLYDELGRLELALEQFEAAGLIEPENVEILNNYGSVLGAMGRYEEAEELLRRAQRLAPEDVSVRASMGILHFRRAMYAMAEADLGWVCEQDDAHGSALYYRGEALNRLGRFDEALQALERATVLQPQNAKAFYTLGHLYDRKHMGEEAALMYRRARELSRG
ncbi:MAG: Helicase associated domain protein [Gemmatimonadota bacterium]|nr:Helicase associated domain protein [Gemmatimonadota bacterium]